MVGGPTRIEKLLAADERNVRVSPELMRQLHPWAVGAFQDIAAMFRLLYDVLGGSEAEHAIDRQLGEIARAHAVSEQELIDLLKAGKGGDITGAPERWARLWTLRVVKVLVMACQRYWSWGAVELLRLRPTAALAYLRLQAEAVGLIALFLKDDALAYRWSHLATKREGKRFFGETQTALKEVLAGFDLANVYDIASSTAQHVRMAGLVRGLASRSGVFGLADQEFDPKDPYSFHLAVAHFHRIQSRIPLALGAILPNVRSEEWIAAEEFLRKSSDELWSTLERRYAREIAEQGNDEDGA